VSKFGVRKCCPEIADMIESLWGTEALETYLLELMALHDEDSEGFSLELYNEISGLLDLHRDLD